MCLYHDVCLSSRSLPIHTQVLSYTFSQRTVLLHIVACRQKTCIQSSCCPEMFHCFHMLSFHFQNDSQKIMWNCTVRIFLHVLWNQLFTLTDASALYIFSDLSAKLLQFSISVLSLFFIHFYDLHNPSSPSLF